MSLKSKAKARLLDLVSEGEIVGLVDGAKSIYLNDTPLQNADGTYNFEDVVWEQRTGTNSQDYIAGIPAVEAETTVSTEVKNGTPVVRAIAATDADAVRVTISVPALYKAKDDGSLGGRAVDIAIDVQPSGGSYTQVITDTINGKATGKYQRSYRIDLTGSSPWNVRVRRLTADNTGDKVQDKTFWDSYTTIVDAKLRYPNSAIVSTVFDSAAFSGIPTRAFDLKLKKVSVPVNYDPETRVYTGAWNGTFKTAWTDNPAWCFYDMITNTRYGLGGYISAASVDKWALYTIGQYCDELVDDGFGGTEPRFTCNLYLGSQQEAYKVVRDMATCFRSMLYWSSGSITLSQDAPSDPMALFTQSNVIDGMFKYSGASAKARHTVVLVTWNDPSDFYKQKVEYVEDAEAIARFGIVQTEVVAIGCTSRGQANRVGRWLLYSERYESETVSFATGVEGATVRPGDIIKVADASRAGVRLGGRVKSATTSAITLDSPVTLGSSSWTMYAMLPDGSVASSGVASASGAVVNLTTPLAAAPQTGAQWIMTTSSVEVQTFRVLTLAEQDGGAIEITALRHDANKYDAVENGLVLETRDFTNLTDTPAAPGALTTVESLYTYQSEVRAMISVGWENVTYATAYQVQWSQDGTNFTTATTSVSDFDLLDITPGEYTFRVYSVGATGKRSDNYSQTTLTALGKTAPPADVTGFTSVIDPNIGVTLNWSKVADLDLDVYEVREGSTWSTATVVGQVKGTTIKIGLVAASTKTYLVKALDTTGNYSETEASTTVTISAASAPTVSAAFAGENIVVTWNAVAGSLATSSYEIRYGASFAAGTSLGTIKGTSFSTKANWSGARSFWVAATDISGNTGTAGTASATVVLPGTVTVTQEVIDNNVLLKWGDATATLPLDYYELRKGLTWAGATVIGRISSRFTAIFESSAGTFTYWVAGVDVAGNVGSTSSVAALVNQPPDYQLQFNQDSTFGGTRSNFTAYDATSFVAPINTTETWASHFTSRGWTTPQDQITAGYPVYAQPTPSSGYYEETFDYGTVLAATKVSASLTYSTVIGTVTVTPTISVKKLVGDAWTDYAGLSSVFVTDFRYVKVRYDFASSGGDDLVNVTGLNVRFDVKLKNDAGLVSAVSTDSGGTAVSFNVSFVDVQSITVTPKGTAARIAVYDFVDVPNPTSFKVLLFDTAGNRVSGDVSWNVKGV